MGVGSRGEAGSETHRRKLGLGVKFGTCRELEERKGVVTSLGAGLQEKAGILYLPGDKILKLCSGRQ